VPGAAPIDSAAVRWLTNDELACVRAALISDRGDALREALFQLNIHRPVTRPDGVAFAKELGWIGDDNKPTEFGSLIRDPLREYSLWLEREGVMASGDVVPVLQREHYAGKRVIELGSGGGCNLLTLQGLDGTFIGLEPMPVYVQMMPILAELSGKPAPAVGLGFAEDIPFADNSFDIVLCYSSHQYMDIDKALAEMTRVVADDGRLTIIGNSLHPFTRESIERFVRTRRLGTLKYDTKAIANTMSYQYLGRRMFHSRGASTTGLPTYPSSSYMAKRLAELGFAVDDELTAQLPSGETALFARRS